MSKRNRPTDLQAPGRKFKFPCGHEGHLPSLGESDGFGFWIEDERFPRKGFWRCMKCIKEANRHYHQTVTKGLGPSGEIGKIRYILRKLKERSRRRGHAYPTDTPEQVLGRWREQNNTCAACGDFLGFFETQLDHNHTTGEIRGFVHKHCNMAEGLINTMSIERLRNFLNFYRPEIFLDNASNS